MDMHDRTETFPRILKTDVYVYFTDLDDHNMDEDVHVISNENHFMDADVHLFDNEKNNYWFTHFSWCFEHRQRRPYYGRQYKMSE